MTILHHSKTLSPIKSLRTYQERLKDNQVLVVVMYGLNRIHYDTPRTE